VQKTSVSRSAEARTGGKPRPGGVAAGILLLIAGTGTLLGIITAEALYPVAFDPGVNTVSDLGAMRPENVVRQPSAAIFDGTMIAMGLCIGVAAVLLHRLEGRLATTLPLLGLAAGMVGVGFVPGYHLTAHTLIAYLAFLSGGAGALLTARLQSGPLRVVHLVLGTASLCALVGYTLFQDTAPGRALGEGGAERWVVYPVALWLVVLGTSLAARGTTPRPGSA